MSDLIERAAAIDAVMNTEPVALMDENHQVFTVAQRTKDVIDAINAMPSAQPESCEDAVSRDSVSKWLDRWEGYIDKDMINRMQYKVCDIPSVKPDIPIVDTPTVDTPNCDDVVFQKGQYSPTWNGSYDKEPSEDSWAVAELLLTEGSQIPEDCLFQAEFPQGSGTWKTFQTIYGTTYICYR